MKKLILLLVVFMFPLISCSKVTYLDIPFENNFSWVKFLDDNKYDGGNGKRLWKYGYVKGNGVMLPKAPPKVQVPEYLSKHPLAGNDLITLDNVNKKSLTKKDAERFVIINYGGYIDTGGYHALSTSRVWGITPEGIFFIVPEGTVSAPFKRLVDSLMITIQSKCAFEDRKPTIIEKYYMLFYASTNVNALDTSYYAKNQDSITLSWYGESIFGIMKIFLICFFVLFCMMVPAIAVLLLKRFTPEGSIIHSAACMVEWLIILVGGATLVKSITKK